jgi:sulfide:quinone oxidoreductase
MHRIVILGGGTGGTLSANRLRKSYSADEASITVVDENDDHLYQPGLLFIPFGQRQTSDLIRPRGRQLLRGIDYVTTGVDHVDLPANTVVLNDGSQLVYDVLVVATGSVVSPEETEGLTGEGWMEKVFTFYTPEGATALATALDGFTAGRLVVSIVDLPIKCPVAPMEFCFLADSYFRERGVRDDIEITYVTPLDAAFTRPVCAQVVGGMLDERRIELVTEFNTANVDGGGGRLISFDGREVPFDLAVVTPVHSGAPCILRSEGLGDALGFVAADQHTLQSTASPNVFAIGDATSLPASKAGSVADFEGTVLVANIRHYLAGEPLDARFDGHANCFIESGDKKAMLIDFNYELEPVPGHFPGRVGLPLLKPTRLNHLGKLMFQWVYWHALLPGRDIPGIHSAMPRRGKQLAAATKKGVS